MELADLSDDLTIEERVANTEGFFSRGIHWIQQRLDMSAELATEIEALRHARNELAHHFLTRHEVFGVGGAITYTAEETADFKQRSDELHSRLHSRLPEKLQREMAETDEEFAAERRRHARGPW